MADATELKAMEERIINRIEKEGVALAFAFNTRFDGIGQAA